MRKHAGSCCTCGTDFDMVSFLFCFFYQTRQNNKLKKASSLTPIFCSEFVIFSNKKRNDYIRYVGDIHKSLLMISQLYFQVTFSLTLLLCFLVKFAKMDAA